MLLPWLDWFLDSQWSHDKTYLEHHRQCRWSSLSFNYNDSRQYLKWFLRLLNCSLYSEIFGVIGESPALCRPIMPFMSFIFKLFWAVDVACTAFQFFSSALCFASAKLVSVWSLCCSSAFTFASSISHTSFPKIQWLQAANCELLTFAFTKRSSNIFSLYSVSFLIFSNFAFLPSFFVLLKWSCPWSSFQAH